MCSKKSQTNTGVSNPNLNSGIVNALFPRIRRKVLALFLLNPEKRFYFRETVRIIGNSPGSIQRELKSLTTAGILKMEPIGIQLFYSANEECPIYEELRSLAIKTFGIVDVLSDVLERHKDKIQIAWIHGSIVTGADTSQSDVDIIVIGKLSFRDLVSILKPVETSLQRALNPSLYTKEEFLEKYKGNNHFVNTVVKSEKLFVLGGENELGRMVQE